VGNGLRKIAVLVKRNKDRGNSYLKSDLPLRSVPGQANHYHRGKSPLSKFKQWLLRRKHRQQVEYRPAGGKKILGSLTGGALLFAVILVAGAIANGERIMRAFQSIAFFQVTELTITGCDIVSKEIVRDSAGIILHQTSLIGLDRLQLEDKLSSVPWVARATVDRNWPSSVEIRITENRPVALLHMQSSEGGGLHYMDGKGTPFLEVVPGADVDFPVITGLYMVEDSDVRGDAFAKVLVLLQRLQSNDPYLPAQSVSEIHVTPEGELVLYLVEYPFPIFFGNGNTKRNYARLIEVLKELYKKQKGKELISGVQYIQMDYFDEKVLVAQGGSG
jgi:cell division septal protein FtsQ